MLEVTFDGLDELIRDIQAMGAAAEAEIERAIKETTAEAAALIVQSTPVGQTGHARRGWDMTFPAPLVGRISTNLPILWFLEFGTGLFSEADGAPKQKYKIAPVRAKALAFQWGKAATLGLTTSLHEMGKDTKGRTLYRSKAGNATVNKRNAADLVVRKYVMHPGIKPVGMVRGNLRQIREIFQRNVEAASDRLVERFLRGF